MRIKDAFVRIWKTEYKHTPSGLAIADLFVSSMYKKKEGEPEYYNWSAVAFAETAKAMQAEGIKKDDTLIIVNGLMKHESWIGKDGVTQYKPKLYIYEYKKYTKAFDETRQPN